MPDPASAQPPTASSAPGALIATFLLTDVEGSTRLWDDHPDEMAAMLEAHDRILRSAIERHGGTVVKTTGDGFLARFDDPLGAFAGAADGQRGLAAHDWGPAGPLRVRMALHAGTAQARDGDFFGPALNRVARLLAIGNGGQVLVSGVAAALVGDRLPGGLELLDLGEQRLRDFERPERVHELAVEGLEGTRQPLRSVGPARTNLPGQATTFVGRDGELAGLRRVLGSSRQVTLIGTGGTGKTRLLLQAAAGLVDAYRDGVWLVELAPVGDPAFVPQAVAAALGVREQRGVGPAEAVTDFLRSKELLLLLDNCEHVIDGAAGLAGRLLSGCPALSIAATSREALAIAGETVFQVPSLAVPESPAPRDVHDLSPAIPFDRAAASDAVRLFVDRAAAAQPGFALTPENAAAVVEICRRLDGIPLAIELAAARVTVLSVDEILQRLGDRFRLLTGGRRTAVPRQQTLQALIDWSWDLLADNDRRLLRRLSVFSGGWSLEAATAICGTDGDDSTDVLDALARLVERSLVIVERGASTRYRLLETIRQYARGRLAESGEADAIQARHLDHFLALAERAAPALRGPAMAEWVRRLGADADNIRAAMEWALEVEPEQAARLAVALTMYWQTRSTWTESIAWLAQALERARALPPPEPPEQRRRDALVATLMAETAFAVSTSGRGDTRDLANEAIALAHASGDDAALLEVLVRASTALIFSGSRDHLRELSDEIIRLATDRGDDMALAMVGAGLANDASMRDPAAADALISDAARRARRTGNPFTIGFVALTRARVLGRTGRPGEAIPFFDEAFASFAELPDSYFPLMARSDLAHALRIGGRLDEALATFRETIHGWEHFGNRGAIANELEGFALIALARGEPERATRLLGAAQGLRDAASAGRMPWEQLDVDAAIGRLREELDPAAFERAWAAGGAMDVEAAVSLAIAP